jgi:hypothetical protein
MSAASPVSADASPAAARRLPGALASAASA